MNKSAFLPVAGLYCLVGAACAQDAAAPQPTDAWKFMVGVGVASQPKFPGSSERRTTLLPVISAAYGRYFIGAAPGAGVPAGVGVYLIQDSHWNMGVGLGGNLSKPRKESDSPRLAGLGDIEGTALGSIFASYNDRWYAVRANVVADIAGKHEGATASLDFEGRLPLGRLMLSAGPGLTWANRSYTQTYFGIDAAQSEASGRAQYDGKSGLNAVRFNVGGNYQITSEWGLGLRAGISRLEQTAADSPVTEKRNQATVALFANYKF